MATTAFGNIANLYTTASLPALYSPGTTLTAQIAYGNNGNQTTSDTQLILELDSHFTFISASNSGYTVSGDQLIFALGEVVSSTSGHLTLQLQVASDPLLVEDNTPLVLTASISSLTAELDLNDNLSSVQTLPLQGGLLTLEGNVYIDVDGSHSLTEGDTTLQHQKVVYSGMNTTGETFTDVQGKYSILGLEPGRYELHIVPNAGYDSIFSKGGKNLSV
ncbi:MAG: DUF11 domain-containing protein [Candidatus Peribacteria bacterium]|nr:DUF11 domain-containing protein [Candidatus Peribacteria bacterium]